MKPATLAALKRYVEERTQTGDFLRAVLENNLMESFGRADDENRADLFEICEYIYNDTPFACHGSPEKVTLWLIKEPRIQGAKEPNHEPE